MAVRTAQPMWLAALITLLLLLVSVTARRQGDKTATSQTQPADQQATLAVAAPASADNDYGNGYGEDLGFGYTEDKKGHTKHHKKDFGPGNCPGLRTWCACNCPLDKSLKTDLCSPGTCQNTADGTLCIDNGCSTTDAAVTPYAFCRGSALPGTGGSLCYQATCPSDGEINISADGTGSNSCPTGGGSNSSFGGLLLFKWPQGAAFNPAATPIANTSSDPSAPLLYRAPCRSGDNFRLCETGNLFLTDSVVFGFLGLYPRACPAKCSQVQGQCTPKQLLNPFKEKEGKMVTASQKHDISSSSSSSEAVMKTQEQDEGTPTIVATAAVGSDAKPSASNNANHAKTRQSINDATKARATVYGEYYGDKYGYGDIKIDLNYGLYPSDGGSSYDGSHPGPAHHKAKGLNDVLHPGPGCISPKEYCLCSCKSEPTSLVERPRIAEEFCPAGCKKLRCVSNDPKAA